MIDDTTQHKQGKIARYELISAALNTANVLVVILNAQGRIARFNRACERTTGYAFKEVEGKHPWDLLIIPEQVESVKALFKRLCEGQLPNNNENFWVTKEGERRLISWSNTALLDHSGQVQYIVGTGIDITECRRVEAELERYHDKLEERVQERTAELATTNAQLAKEVAQRRQVEKALRESQANLANAQRIAHTGSWDWDIITGTVNWSDETYQILGVPRHVPATYQAFIAAIHPQDRDTVHTTHQQAFYGNRPYALEFRILRPDGSERIVRSDLEVYYSADEEPMRMSGIIHDITDSKQAQAELHKAHEELELRVTERTAELLRTNESLRREIVERQRAEEALREGEARLRAIANAVPDLILVLDEDGRYVEIVTARQQLLYADPVSIQGRLMSEVLPPERAEQFLALIRKTLTTRQPQILEYSLYIAAVTELRWFEARMAPIETSATSKPAVVVVARDITERKAAEERLRQAQKMEAIGQLTGGVAHDFNNLLAIVLGNLELLDEQLADRLPMQDLLRRALAAAERGAVLTQRLLAFSRQQPLQARPIDLNELVAGMIDLLRRTLGETIQIQTVLAGELWPTLVDPGQFENALLNLVLNARDAMPQGGRLTLETANSQLDEDYAATHEDVRAGEYIMLTVGDTGIGMLPVVLERAVEPFFTTKEVGKGSGLGLSMVYGLVTQSGGHLAIDSEPGQGTTVRVYLPRVQDVKDLKLAAKAAETLRSAGEETILVVEDDASVRQLAISMLSSLGYSTLEAFNARAALQILEEQPQVALLFTDVVLPGGMDGAELAREARCHRPDLKVLFTSGYTESALIRDGRLEEGVELLAKPYRKAELADRLRAILAAG